MRILHVFDHSLPLQSGYVFRSLGLLKAQRAFGWETVHLTTPKHTAPAGGPVETVDGWTFYRTPAPGDRFAGLPGGHELVQMRATARRLAEVVAETKPDLIHAHSPALNAVPALTVGRRLGLPVVYEVRAFWEDAAVDLGTCRPGDLRYRATRGLETWALRRMDAAFTICEGLFYDIVERGIPADKLTVIPNAVDIEHFPGPARRDGALAVELGLEGVTVLGFIGSFYHYEGLPLLIEAAARSPGVKVLLVGGGPEEERLRRMTAELGIGDRVVFTGRVKHEEVDRYYGLVDVFVYPRRPMRLTDLVTPLKPLEAMAQHRLVLASDVGGHRELIRDGVTGFLFRAGDVEALVRRIGDVRGLGLEARQRMLLDARRFVERERTWRVSAAGYRPVYDRLVARRASHGAVGAVA